MVDLSWITSWLKDNSWVANWAAVFLLATLDTTILYYVFSFLGKMTRGERQVLRWRMRSYGSLTESDKARMAEEKE